MKKEVKDTVTSIFLKIAEENEDKYVRSYQLNANAVSVVCFEDQQLDDKEHLSLGTSL